MKKRTSHGRWLGVMCAITLAACQGGARTKPVDSSTHPARVPAVAPAASAAAPERLLLGRWAVDQPGEATKQFTPDKGNFAEGRADGFWPDGGRYEVSELDAKQRKLAIRIAPVNQGEEDHFKVINGVVTFTADGNHMTVRRKLGNKLPDTVTTYYRAR